MLSARPRSALDYRKGKELKFPTSDYRPPREVQRCQAEQALLEQYFRPEQLTACSQEDLRCLHLRLINNPLQLCLESISGMAQLQHADYIRAVRSYCPSRSQFTESDCQIGRLVICRINDLYKAGYVTRYSDLVFSNPGEAAMIHSLLEEMGFEQCDEFGSLMWDYRSRCRSYVNSALYTQTRADRAKPDNSAELAGLLPNHRVGASLISNLCRNRLTVVGLYRGRAKDTLRLQASLEQIYSACSAGLRRLSLNSSSDEMWSEVQGQLMTAECIVITRVELFGVYNLAQILNLALASPASMIVLQLDMDAETEMAELVRARQIITLTPDQPPLEASHHDEDGSLTLDSMCYVDELHFTRAGTVRRVYSLDELDSGFPFNWISLAGLIPVLTAYSSRLSYWACTERNQLCVDSSRDQRTILKAMEEVLGGTFYNGMKLRLSDSSTLPKDQRRPDPLKRLYVCDAIQELQGDTVIQFSESRDWTQPVGQYAKYAAPASNVLQQEVLTLEELNSKDIELLIFFSSSPVTHRHLRRLRRHCNRQVLIIADERNMHALVASC
jgi:hypothetical protein